MASSRRRRASFTESRVGEPVLVRSADPVPDSAAGNAPESSETICVGMSPSSAAGDKREDTAHYGRVVDDCAKCGVLGRAASALYRRLGGRRQLTDPLAIFQALEVEVNRLLGAREKEALEKVELGGDEVTTLEAAREEIEALRAELDKANAARRSARVDADRLQGELTRIVSAPSSARQARSGEASPEVGEARKELEAARDRLGALEEENAKLRVRLRAEGREDRREVSSGPARARAGEQSILQLELAESQLEVSTLRARVEDLVGKLARAESALSRAVQASDDAKADLRAKVMRLEGALEKAKEEGEASSKRVRGDVAALRRDKARVDRELNQARDRLNDVEDMRETAERRAAAMTSRLATERKALAQEREARRDLEDRLAAAERAFAQAQRRIELLEDEQARAEASSARRMGDRPTLRADLAQLQERLEKCGMRLADSDQTVRRRLAELAMGSARREDGDEGSREDGGDAQLANLDVELARGEVERAKRESQRLRDALRSESDARADAERNLAVVSARIARVEGQLRVYQQLAAERDGELGLPRPRSRAGHGAEERSTRLRRHNSERPYT